jgi:hypothetical protein
MWFDQTNDDLSLVRTRYDVIISHELRPQKVELYRTTLLIQSKFYVTKNFKNCQNARTICSKNLHSSITTNVRRERENGDKKGSFSNIKELKPAI